MAGKYQDSAIKPFCLPALPTGRQNQGEVRNSNERYLSLISRDDKVQQEPLILSRNASFSYRTDFEFQ
jgi:hypothetical protein